jgi:DNA-binding NarL/FixJ family response regulator
MIKILIADDHAIVRKGMIQLIIEEYPSAIIAEAADAEELLKLAFTSEWDVIICDLSMPGRSGLDALKQIKQTLPPIPVLIMSMYPEEQYTARVLKAGASGYLSKVSIHDELIKAIKTVLKGKKYIPVAIAEMVVDAFINNSDQPSYTLLSDREFEILKHLALGESVSNISKKLSLSSNTVSTYRSRIMEKLHKRSNADLTRYALELKLI